MKRICLGKIVSAHGVKGLVKILPFADNPKLIETLGPVFAGETADETLSVIMKNSAGNKHWLASVKGVTERNGAEALRGVELWTIRDKLPSAGKGRVYYADLIGMQAVDMENVAVGKVIGVQNFGAGDLLEIKPAGGESFYLPYAENTVHEVKDGNIVINIPEGLR